LPDGTIMQVGEIRKAMAGEDYRYIPKGERKPKYAIGLEHELVVYYFNVNRLYQKFGLPNGSGWLNELSWVLDFLAYMDDLKQQIELWRAQSPHGKD
jgi:hypothetical protein